jgi:hypothetical protein
MVVTAGGLSPSGDRWIPAKNNFLVPVRALSKMVRGKFLDGLEKAFEQGTLTLSGNIADWRNPASTPNRPSVDPDMCSATWAITPTGWPSPTRGSSPLMARRLPSGPGTMSNPDPTDASTCLPSSLSVASSSMCSPKALSAFATLASWHLEMFRPNSRTLADSFNLLSPHTLRLPPKCIR